MRCGERLLSKEQRVVHLIHRETQSSLFLVAQRTSLSDIANRKMVFHYRKRKQTEEEAEEKRKSTDAAYQGTWPLFTGFTTSVHTRRHTDIGMRCGQGATMKHLTVALDKTAKGPEWVRSIIPNAN